MLPDNSASVKIGSNFTNISYNIYYPPTATENIMGVLSYQCIVFIVFNIPIYY